MVFVVGTTILAIAAALVASHVSKIGNWTMLIGGGCIMYAADILSELEQASRLLATSTGRAEGITRSHVLKWHGPKGTPAVFWVGTILSIVGVTLKAFGR